MEIRLCARASSLGTWASHPIAVWLKEEGKKDVICVNEAIMIETISATHRKRAHQNYIQQTGQVTLFLWWWRRQVRAPYSARE